MQHDFEFSRHIAAQDKPCTQLQGEWRWGPERVDSLEHPGGLPRLLLSAGRGSI